MFSNIARISTWGSTCPVAGLESGTCILASGDLWDKEDIEGLD